MIGDWIYDHLGWITAGVVAVFIGLVIYASHDIDRECNSMMKLARTSHDSLEVRISCSRMHSDLDRNIAIGAAAGAIAGSAGSRR